MQMPAQSMSRAMQRVIFRASCSSRQAAAHFRQAAAQALQAAIQSAYRSKFSRTVGRIIGCPPWGWVVDNQQPLSTIAGASASCRNVAWSTMAASGSAPSALDSSGPFIRMGGEA
ncbi:hypothetical protein D3C81_1826670 [compost metagenome]